MDAPRHYAVIDNYNRELTLKLGDQVIVKSTNALILKEVGRTVMNPVFYFPKEDVQVELIKEDGRSTHCPIKGDATYWTIANAPEAPYFAWSYEEALPRTKKIAGYVAFNVDVLSISSNPINS